MSASQSLLNITSPSFDKDGQIPKKSTKSHKKDLLQAMDGHILQSGDIVGYYKP